MTPLTHRRTTCLILWLWSLSILPGTGCRAASEPAPSLQQEFRAYIMEERRPAELAPKVLESSVRDGKRVERVAFETEVGERVVAVVVRPETAAEPLPAVIAQHWLGGSKDDFLLQSMLWQLASRGYLALAIDGRYRGQRAMGSKSLEEAIRETLRTGKGRPWLVDTVYDLIRTVDYLQTRPDVDAERIGMTGISAGGIETWMAAVADSRVKVVVPAIGVTRFVSLVTEVSSADGQERVKLFRKALEEHAQALGEPAVNDRVFRSAWEKLLPGSLDRFDPARLVPLIAPRPLLILSHEKDELIPLRGAEEVHAAALQRYRELSAEDRLKHRIAPGLRHSGQDLTEFAALYDWFDRWLKPPPAAEKE
jgi:cephalosporin-C deacetylase-like acetyl esterase